MPGRQLWIAAPIALASWLALATADAPVLRPGETVRLDIPAGDPEKTAVTFELVVTEDGPLTVETSTLYFDTLLKVFDADAGEGAKPIAEDDDGGVGWNSRLTFEAAAGRSYRGEVSAGTGEDWGGRVEVAALVGKPSTAGVEERERDAAYWEAFAAEAVRLRSPILEAEALLGRGAMRQEWGDYAEARQLYEAALKRFSQAAGPEHPRAAVAAGRLATLLQAMAEYATARPLYERALAIREKVNGPEHPHTASSLNNLANLLRAMGEYAAARPLYERALAIREKVNGPEHRETALSLNNLAGLLHDTGEYAAARPLYERALAIREKVLGPEHPHTASSLNSLARLLRKTGEYADARPLFERALAIREKMNGPEHPSTAACLNNLAGLFRDMGEYTAARPLFERALAIREKMNGPEHPSTAACLNNLALLFRDMGEHAAARPLYERALAIDEKVQGPEHPDTARDLNNLALLFRDMGEHAAARPLLERTLAIQEKVNGSEHPATAKSLNNLALLLQVTGESRAARPLFERSLAIREKVQGREHPDTATGVNNLASTLQSMGEYAAARPLLERALAIWERVLGPDHPDVAASLNNLAWLRATLGEIAGALGQALDAERIGREHLQWTGRSLSEREALRYAAVRPSGLNLALTLAARGLEPAERRRALDALVRSRALVLDEMAAQHRAIGGSADPEVARLAGHLASRRGQRARLVVRGPGDHEPEIYRKLLDDARNEQEEAERVLARSSTEFAHQLSRDRLGLDEVAASLPEASALVAFGQYSKVDLTLKSPSTADHHEGAVRVGAMVRSYVAFVLRAGARDPEVVDLGPAAGIDDAVSRWKKEASRGVLLAGDPTLAETAYRESAATLRRRAWDPLAEAIGDAGRVFVVPDGSLNLVNLAALPVDGGGYLIERGPLVHYVSAERDLVPLGEARRGEGLLALGAPRYDATSLFASLRKPETEPAVLISSTATYRGQPSACGDFASMRFDPLPATGTETREIVRLWEKYGQAGSSPHAAALDLRDAAANETALKRSAPGHRVLHLATHGFFLGGRCESALDSVRGIGGLAETPAAGLPDAPIPASGENPLLLSGLVLAGANHRSAAAEGEDDGILTAEEIASLDLSGVEWAVLSACETGVGDVRAGEGVFGLRRAFQVAGAGTLIMSLWSVDDEATRAWMTALYDARLNRRMGTAEAVRRASLDVLAARRKVGESTHPFYWAAFVAAGDWK